MAAVSVRRTLPVAPVAVRVRRSPAPSLRISPTVMARIASARRAPAPVAMAMARRRRCASRCVSIVRPASAASSRAAATCSVVRGRLRLDEPAGRDLLPAAAAKTVEGDERDARDAGSPQGRRGGSAGVDPLDVRDGDPWAPRARDDKLSVGTVGSARKSVARIDRGGVDSDVPEQGGRRDVEGRSAGVAAPGGPPASRGRATTRPGRRRPGPASPGWKAFRSGITAARSRPAASWRTRAALRATLGGRLERGVARTPVGPV